MLSAARLLQVRAEACISLQASWEQVNSSNWTSPPPPWLWETCLSWISNLYVNIWWDGCRRLMEEVLQNVMLWVTGMAGALSDYGHRRHLQGHTIDGQSVLEEVTLKSWRGINFENTAKEYKRWSEISPGELQGERELQLWLGFRDGLGLDDPFDFLWYWHCTCNKMVRRKNKKN